MLRTFLAVELPPDLRVNLVHQQQELRRQLPAASWIRPDALHLTVKFLGDTPQTSIDAIKDSVTEKLGGHGSFVVDIEGLGVFPNSHAPRILWAGVTRGKEAMVSMMAKVEDSLTPLGFPKEGKALHPHITLARVKKEHKRFGFELNHMNVLSSIKKMGSFSVETLTLFQSKLAPTGSVYTPLWTARLSKECT